MASIERFVVVVVLSVVGVLGGAIFLNLLAFCYESLNLYHKKETDSDERGTEGYLYKAKLVYKLNILLAIPAVVALVIYATLRAEAIGVPGASETSVPLDMSILTLLPEAGLEFGLVASLIPVVVNVVLRLAAFADFAFRWTPDGINFDQQDVSDRVMSLGYSFFASIYVTVFIVVVVGIISGVVPLAVDVGTVALDQVSYLLVAFLTTAAVLTFGSEAILYYHVVPETVKDDPTTAEGS